MSCGINHAKDEQTCNGAGKESIMTLDEREAHWGFTLEELHAATKVVRILFHNPSLFVGDEYLQESRLYTMITRDRKRKRENREVYKAIMSNEKTRRKRFKRMQDIEAIRRTEMKREREQVLNSLLLEPATTASANMMIEAAPGPSFSSESLDVSRNDIAADAQHAEGISNELSLRDRNIITLIGAYENIIRLEEAYNTRPAAPDYMKISQLVAQVYRYMPHKFGSQMPPALLPGAAPAGVSFAERERYTAVVKVRIAQRCVELLTFGIDNDDDCECNNGNGLNASNDNADFCDSGDFFVLDSPTLRSVPLLRQCGDLSSASREVVSAIEERAQATDALRVFELVLAEGVVDERFFSQDSDNAARTWSADASLNFFIARRLYASRRIRDYGESPFTVFLRPPVSTDEEPDSYCVFEDLQMYTETRSVSSDDALRLNRWITCHTCRVRYNMLHPYYYSMCHLCGEYNFNKRLLTRDLRGKAVLLTGCRIKIGFAMALSLLRCGARLVGTTRFVHEALARFQRESDYAEWKERLHLFSLDLRDLWVVTQFCAFITQRFPKLFAIINNAAQTIARTREYTAVVRQIETRPPHDLHSCLYEDAMAREWHQFFLSHSSVIVGEPLCVGHNPRQLPFIDDTQLLCDSNRNDIGEDTEQVLSVATRAVDTHSLVFDRYDAFSEQSDRRETNSWVMRLADVPGSEAAELMAINALSPLIINSRLKSCLLNREGDVIPNEGRFIINVSAMEGQFYRFKQVTHPHTNMAKAALNMMTRTSGEDYAQDGIYMNSVDTGWITDESPKAKRDRRAEQLLLCPLDEVDAAARCLDLIYTNSKEYGKFFKDFKEIPW